MTVCIFPARPHKLRSGQWGAVVDGCDVSVGSLLRVESKGGRVWEAIVDRIILADGDRTICKTIKTDGASRDHCYACRPGGMRQTMVDAHCGLCGGRPIYVYE